MGVMGMRVLSGGSGGGGTAIRTAVILFLLALALVAAPTLLAQDWSGTDDDLGLPDSVGPVDGPPDAGLGDGPPPGDGTDDLGEQPPLGDGPPSGSEEPSDGASNVDGFSGDTAVAGNDEPPSRGGVPRDESFSAADPTVVGDGLPPIVVDTLSESSPATTPQTAVPIPPLPSPATAAALTAEIRHLETVRSVLLRDSRRSTWGVGGHVKILVVRPDEFELAARRIRSFRFHLKAALQAPAILFLKSPRSYVRLVELVKWGETTAVGVPRDIQKGYDRLVPVIGVPGSGGGRRHGVAGTAGGSGER